MFVVEPHDGAFRPGLALDKLNQLVDELDTERVAERIRALKLPIASVACMKAESVPAQRKAGRSRSAPGNGPSTPSKG